MLIEVKCHLCEGNDFKTLKDVVVSPFGGESRLVKCKRCGLLFVNPRHEEKDEKKFYASEYFERGTIESWGADRIKTFKYNLKKIEGYKKGGKLLDFGCGMGQFLKLAEDDGWDVLGTEVSKSAAEYARRTFGLEVVESTLKDANFKEDFFDVVTAWNIIDQLSYPLEELKGIYRVLKKSGIVAVRVSNGKFHIFFHGIIGFIGKIYYGLFGFEKPPVFHNYMFSPRTARLILKKAGFCNISILNSKLSIKNELIEKFVYLLCQAIYHLTFKRCVTTPSLLIFAQKG